VTVSPSADNTQLVKDQGGLSSSPVVLFRKVKASGADGVLLAGLIEENGAQLIKDKVKVLGVNDNLPLIAFDGFAQQSTINKAGGASRGMFASIPGKAPDTLTGGGATLVKGLENQLNGQPVEQFAPYAGEAAAVMTDAIATAGPNRPGVVKGIFATKGWRDPRCIHDHPKRRSQRGPDHRAEGRLPVHPVPSDHS
jgi:ABC-type branched-subunit amino acid transport system substrate-binding protein